MIAPYMDIINQKHIEGGPHQVCVHFEEKSASWQRDSKGYKSEIKVLRRNLRTIKKLSSKYPVNPLKERKKAYY